MNYQQHYDRLIDRARHRVLIGYSEKHHVIPRCMGGNNRTENLVRLTAEEHYVSHQLLVKIYPGHAGIAGAAVRIKGTGTNKAYGWLRRRLSEALKGNQYAKGLKHGPMSPERKAHLSEKQKGRKLSEEHKAAVASAKALKVYRASDETKAKMSAAHTGKKLGPCSPERKAKIGAANTGRVRTAEARAKMSAAGKGRKHTPEWIANWRASMQRRKQAVSIEIV